MKRILIFVSTVLQISASAQMTKVWDKDLASSSVENPVLIYKNTSGTVDVIASVGGPGIIIAGNAAGNDVTTGYGQYDYWFCKLGKSGQKISDNTYGGTVADYPVSAVKAADGGYLICGTSSSGVSGNKTLAMPAYNSSVLWLVKIDSGGVLQWQKQVAFNNSSYYTGDVNGNLAICTTINGYAIALTTSTYGTPNSYATYLVTADVNGNTTTAPQLSASYSSSIFNPKTIIQLSNGNLLVGGYTGSAATEMLLTATGTQISTKQYTSGGQCEIISAKELSANGNWLFFAKSVHNNASGYTRTVNSKASAGNYDIWVFQTNNTGVIQPGQNAIGCGSVNLADHSNIEEVSNLFYSTSSLGPMAYLLLEADATGGDRAETGKGSTDFWLVQYDYVNSVIIQENSFGGSNAEQVQSLFVDGTNAYLLGTSASPISGDKTEALKSGTTDLWAVRTCLSTDIPVIANATYLSHPALPGVRGYFVYPCSNQGYTLGISNPQSYNTYNWYNAATGGTLLGTGTSYNITSVSTTRQYIWVEADNGTCLGNRVAINIVPIRTPLNPTYTGATLLCSGSQLVLAGQINYTGQSSGSYFKLHWWDSSLNNILSENDTLKINNVTAPFDVWLSVVDSVPANPSIGLPLTMCESGLQQINIIVDNVPTPIVSYTNPTCIYDPTTLTVTNASSNTVNWYNSAGNLISTGNVFNYTNSSYTDYVYSEIISAFACRSVKTQSAINVQHASPASPAIQNTYLTFTPGEYDFPTCSNSSAAINIDQPNASFIYSWYNAATGGSQVNTGSSISIPSVNYNGTYQYWVSANDGTCTGDRTDVKVRPIKTPGLPQIVSAITNICKSDTLILIASKDTSTQAGGAFYLRWYNSSNQLLHTGDTLIVPNIQSASTYYCAETDSIPYDYFDLLGYYTCEGQRASIQVTVDSAPAPMITYSNPICIYNSTTLSVTNGSGYYVNWTNKAGNVINTGNPFVYMNSTNADTLFCTLISSTGCISRKTQMIINVQHALPLVPIIQNTFIQSGTELFPTCSNSSATMNVNLPNTSYLYDWYNGPTAGNIVNVGTSITIPSVNYNATYEYWVCANDGTCIGNRQDIKVRPIKTPGLPQITSSITHICRFDTLILIAAKDTSTQAGGHFYIRWYNSSNQLIHTGDTLIIPNIQTAAIFYCSEVDSIPYNYFPSLGSYLCEGQKTSRQITLDTVADPIVSVPNPACEGRNITLTVTNVVNSSIHWYKANGNPLSNGVSYTIPSIQAIDTVLSQAVGTNTCKSRRVQTIVTPQKPAGDFMSIKTILNSGDVIQFNNLTSGGNTWYWDFGDGSNSTSQSPHHYFYNPGYYNIILIATSSVGCTDTVAKNNYIEVLLGSGINEYSILKDVKLFPNPFTDGVWLDIPVNVNSVNVSLKNIIGEELRQFAITGKEFISLNDLSEGIYIMQIMKENEILNIKIVKE